MWPCIVDIVWNKDQLDATKYADLLTQHVSGTNMPIIRSTNSELRVGIQTCKAVWVVQRWAVRCVYCSEEVATSCEQYTHLTAQRYTTQTAFQVGIPKRNSLFVLLMMGIVVPEIFWVNKSTCFVASSWSLSHTITKGFTVYLLHVRFEPFENCNELHYVSSNQPRGLVVRVSEYWSWGPGFDSRFYHGDFSLKGKIPMVTMVWVVW
jgi:hypothetical protein